MLLLQGDECWVCSLVVVRELVYSALINHVFDLSILLPGSVHNAIVYVTE